MRFKCVNCLFVYSNTFVQNEQAGLGTSLKLPTWTVDHFIFGTNRTKFILKFVAVTIKYSIYSGHLL